MVEKFLEFLRKYWVPLSLGLLILVFSIINLDWNIKDTRPLSDVDASVFLDRTVQFIDNIKQGRLRNAVTELDASGRPPTYQLLSVPFILLFGRSQDAAMLVNLLYGAILIISTYGIGKIVGDKKSGLLAAFLIATYPPILAYMHTFRTGFGLPVSLAFWVWMLLVTIKTRSIKSALLFGVSISFGALNHPHFIYVAVIPTIIFGFYLLLFQTEPKYPQNIKAGFPWLINKFRDPFVYKGLVSAALIVAVSVLPWYLTEGLDLLKLLSRVSASRGGVQIGSGFQYIDASYWWYLQTMPHVISYVLALLFGLGLVMVLLKKRQIFSYVLILTLLFTYLIFSNLSALAWKRFSVLLPIIAAITAVGIFEVRQKYLRNFVIFLCIIVGIFNLSYVTWGENSWNRPIAIALGAVPNTISCSRPVHMAFCPNPAENENYSIQEILETIANDPSCRTESCNLYVLDAGDYFEYVDFQLQSSLSYPDLEVQIKPFLFSRISRSGDYDLEWLLGDYLVYISEYSLYGYREAIRKILLSPPESFSASVENLGIYPLSDGSSIHLVKRTAPATLVEAEEIIINLDVTASTKATIETWMEKHPKKFDKSINQIIKYFYNGDYDAANKLLLMIVNSDLSTKVRTDILNESYSELLSNGEPDKIIELSDLVPNYMYNADTWIILGRAYRQTGQKELAKSAFESAISIDPNNYLGNHLLTGMLIGEGYWQTALEYAENAYRVARNEEQQVVSGIRLVSVYQHLTRDDKACELIAELTEIEGGTNKKVSELARKLDCK